MNKDKFVDLKIRYKYKEILKEYCQKYGYKMYALIEQLIEKECSDKNMLKS